MSTVIDCKSVYKIFGSNADKLLQDSGGKVDAKKFQEAGCIVGVNNASFTVNKGEMLVVMGLSGSGKSTLLRCISRLTEVTSGEVFIDGENISQMNSKQLIELRRDKMGMVFQNFALLPHKSVGEKNSVDVGKDTTGCDGNTSKQLVQLLIVLNGKGDVTGHDTSLLVVTGGIAGKLEDLGTEVLEDGGKVDGCTGSHTGGIFALTEVTSDTSDGEL